MKANTRLLSICAIVILCLTGGNKPVEASDVLDTLLDGIAHIPGADTYTEAVKGQLSPAGDKANYETTKSGPAHFYVEKKGKVAFLLVKGNSKINSMGAGGALADMFGNTGLKDIIFAAVGPSAGGDYTAAQLPGELGKVVKKSYGGTIPLKTGMQMIVIPKIKGHLAKVLKVFGFPTKKLVMRAFASVSLADMSLVKIIKTKKIKGKPKPVGFVELMVRGQWNRPLGIPKAKIRDAKFFLDSGGVAGFWGNMTLDKDNYLMFFLVPTQIGSPGKEPTNADFAKAFLEVQMGFGAEEIHLGQYVKLLAALSSAKLSAGASLLGPLAEAQGAATDAVFTAVDTLPLDALKVTNDQMKGYRWKKGNPFPSLDRFNLVLMGPMATTVNGEKGPLFRVKGNVQALGYKFGKINVDMSTSGINALAKARINLSLGSIGDLDLGKIGGVAKLNLKIDDQRQFLRLLGKINAGPLGGKEIRVFLTSGKVGFKSPATCAFPFDIAAELPFKNPATLKLSDIKFSPAALVPDPETLIHCAGEIFYAARDGAVYAFNGTKELGAMVGKGTEQAANAIGDGIMASGGKIVDAANQVAAAADKMCTELKQQKAGGVCDAFGEVFETIVEVGEAVGKGTVKVGKATGEAFADGYDGFTAGSDVALEETGSFFKGAGCEVTGWFGGGCAGPIYDVNLSLKRMPLKVTDVSLGGGKGVLALLAPGSFKESNAAFYQAKTGEWSEIKVRGAESFTGLGVIKDSDILLRDQKNNLWRGNPAGNGKWTNIGKTLKGDLAVGGGYVWTLRGKCTVQGCDVVRAKLNKTRQLKWQKVGGVRLQRIAARRNGTAVGINTKGIYKYVGGKNPWRRLPKTARDIAVDGNDRIWIADTDGKLLVWRYDSVWSSTSTTGISKVSANSNQIWLGNESGDVWSTAVPDLGKDPGPAQWRFVLQNKSTKKCMDNQDRTDANGHGWSVVSGECEVDKTRNQFYVRQSGKYVRLISARSGLCLGVPLRDMKHNALVQQMVCKLTDNMRWQRVKLGGGWFSLKAEHSGKCLALAGIQGPTPRFYQRVCAKKPAEMFRVIGIDKTPPGDVKGPAGKPQGIKPEKDWRRVLKLRHTVPTCVDSLGLKVGAAASVFKCNSGANQQLRFVPVGKATGSFQMAFGSNKLCLGLKSGWKQGKKIRRTFIQQQKCKVADKAQHWTIRVLDDGWFSLVNTASRMCLTSKKEITAGTALVARGCRAKDKKGKTNAMQQFTFAQTFVK